MTAVGFDIFVAAVAKGGNRLRTIAVSISSPDLLLKSTASCNFENVSPLISRCVEVEVSKVSEEAMNCKSFDRLHDLNIDCTLKLNVKMVIW